jgi:hypothetical protein
LCIKLAPSCLSFRSWAPRCDVLRAGPMCDVYSVELGPDSVERVCNLVGGYLHKVVRSRFYLASVAHSSRSIRESSVGKQ